MTPSRLLLPIALACILAIACSGDKQASTPTAEPIRADIPATLTAVATTPAAVATTTPSLPRPTPTPIPRTLWLLDLEAGTRTTLTDSLESVPYSLTIDPATQVVEVRYWFNGSRIELRIGPDGNQISRTEVVQTCDDTGDGAEFGGRFYVDVNCGLISPDGHWMTYQTLVQGPPEARQRGDWDQWVVDLNSGETRLLHADLRHCGGCDGHFGASWSPSSRFLYFPELVQTGSTFLADMQTTAVRELFSGSTEIHSEPSWSPSKDNVIVYRKDGVVTIGDLVSGASTSLPLLGAYARFDATGRYVYASDAADGRSTTIYNAETGAFVATLPGETTYLASYGVNLPVAGSQDGFTAAFAESNDCPGVAVYHNDEPVVCLDGRGPEISPDGTRVALTGKHDIVLYDVLNGTQTVLADGVETEEPARMRWDETGRYLIVLWPGYHIGL